MTDKKTANKQGEKGKESEKFQEAMKQILTVSKEELKRREDEWKKTRGKTRRKVKRG